MPHYRVRVWHPDNPGVKLERRYRVRTVFDTATHMSRLLNRASATRQCTKGAFGVEIAVLAGVVDHWKVIYRREPEV